MRLKPDRCPKCGQPPRLFVALLKCRVPLTMFRHRLHGADDFQPEYGELRRVGKPPEVPSTVTLECGGRHKWEAEQQIEKNDKAASDDAPEVRLQDMNEERKR